MGFCRIDYDAWPRRPYFEHYHRDVPCWYSMTADVDITALLRQLAGEAAGRGAEFVTVFYGEDVSEAEAEAAQSRAVLKLEQMFGRGETGRNEEAARLVKKWKKEYRSMV